MHGLIHDFVVLNTVQGGNLYPTGNGPATNGKADEFLKDYPIIEQHSIQPKFEKVLDIGSLDINGNMHDYNFCGAGPNWRDIIGMKEFIGLDLIPGRGVTMVGNAHDIPLKDNYFDLVMCMSVLEHDTDPEKTVKEAYRVTKPGHPLILTTVDQDHPEHKHLGGGDTETYVFITEKEFLAWLIAAGFKKDNIRFVHFETNLMAYCIK